MKWRFYRLTPPVGTYVPPEPTEGKRRRQWDSLTDVERRIAPRLLGIEIPRFLSSAITPANAADVRKYQKSCLEKLGVGSVDALVESHREYRLKFERRAWAARGEEPAPK